MLKCTLNYDKMKRFKIQIMRKVGRRNIDLEREKEREKIVQNSNQQWAKVMVPSCSGFVSTKIERAKNSHLIS